MYRSSKSSPWMYFLLLAIDEFCLFFRMLYLDPFELNFLVLVSLKIWSFSSKSSNTFSIGGFSYAAWVFSYYYKEAAFYDFFVLFDF